MSPTSITCCWVYFPAADVVLNEYRCFSWARATPAPASTVAARNSTTTVDRVATFPVIARTCASPFTFGARIHLRAGRSGTDVTSDRRYDSPRVMALTSTSGQHEGR